MVQMKSSVWKVVPRNFTNFTGKHLCQSLFLIKLQPLGLLKPFYWNHFIKKYLSRTNFKICFTRSCSPSRVTRHILEILLACRHTLVAQNCGASVRLHHWGILLMTASAFFYPLFFIDFYHPTNRIQVFSILKHVLSQLHSVTSSFCYMEPYILLSEISHEN